MFCKYCGKETENEVCDECKNKEKIKQSHILSASSDCCSCLYLPGISDVYEFIQAIWRDCQRRHSDANEAGDRELYLCD